MPSILTAFTPYAMDLNKTKVTRNYSIVFCICSGSYSVLFFLLQMPLMASISVVLTILFLSVQIFLQLKRFNAARVLLVFSFNMALCAYATGLLYVLLHEYRLKILPKFSYDLLTMNVFHYSLLSVATITSVIVYYYIVSESHGIQTSREQNENRIANLFSALNESSIVTFTDAESKITYANDFFVKVTGYQRNELIGKKRSIVSSGFHHKSFYEEMWGTLLSKKVWNGEICNKKKNGDYYWVSTTIIPFLDHLGEVTGYASVSNEITESKKIKEAVIQSSKMSSLGEMASGIAHEINNPLTVVIGNAELLKKMTAEKKHDAVLIDKYSTRILNSAHRMSKIVRGLKSFARTADNDPFQEFRIVTLIENTLELCHERFAKNDIKLRIEPIPETIINGRIIQIEQVLVNLLCNSFDAIERLDERWIVISFLKNDHHISIIITDSGNGISKETADKIMHPFFTTKEIGKGTGLGLSISKGIVEDHKGRLYYDPSSVNTRFVIELPVCNESG